MKTQSGFVFTPAVREKTPMIIALAGPSGSGKTMSADILAMGLAAGGKIAFLDTEGRRGLHYADQFRFDYCELRSPYTPDRFLTAWRAAEAAGYAVIVTDSYSDEYVGEGGLVDMAALEAERLKNAAAAWARPKAAHKLGVRWMRQARCHLIFCLRAEEKVKLEQVEKGGRKETIVVPIGWQPICEKNVPYEMTTSFMLTPEAPGVPRPIKLMEQHRHIFPEGKQITADMGVALAQWCAGGAPPSALSPAPIAVEAVARPNRTPRGRALTGGLDRATLQEAQVNLAQSLQTLQMRAWQAARNGMRELEDFWTGLSSSQRTMLGKDLLDHLKDSASNMARARGPEPAASDDRANNPPDPPDEDEEADDDPVGDYPLETDEVRK